MQRQSCEPMFILSFLCWSVCQQKISCSYLTSSSQVAYSNGKGTATTISLSYSENWRGSVYPELGVASWWLLTFMQLPSTCMAESSMVTQPHVFVCTSEPGHRRAELHAQTTLHRSSRRFREHPRTDSRSTRSSLGFWHVSHFWANWGFGYVVEQLAITAPDDCVLLRQETLM